MSALHTALTETPKRPDQKWFREIAKRLLGQTEFVVSGQSHRLREIEFYYTGEAHPDPFTHGDPLQKTQARWYFHRDEGAYRGGSFKGLDITFGPTTDFGGILIRTISAPDGTVVNGCSLCVDHMLRTSQFGAVKDLDEKIGDREVNDPTAPLFLRTLKEPYEDEIYETARVGLTLKRVRSHPSMPEYIMRRYRFLNAPQAIKKGKVHLVIALHQQGHSVDSIKLITKSPKHSIERYIDDHEAGRQKDSFRSYFYKALKNDELCQLHGTWWKSYGEKNKPASKAPSQGTLL